MLLPCSLLSLCLDAHRPGSCIWMCLLRTFLFNFGSIFALYRLFRGPGAVFAGLHICTTFAAQRSLKPPRIICLGAAPPEMEMKENKNQKRRGNQLLPKSKIILHSVTCREPMARPTKRFRPSMAPHLLRRLLCKHLRDSIIGQQLSG